MQTWGIFPSKKQHLGLIHKESLSYYTNHLVKVLLSLIVEGRNIEKVSNLSALRIFRNSLFPSPRSLGTFADCLASASLSLRELPSAFLELPTIFKNLIGLKMHGLN